MNIDWEVIGTIAGVLALFAKGIHWVWSKVNSLIKQNDILKDKLKECEIASAKKDAALEFTSKFIKDKFIDGLDNFIDNEKN